MKKAIFGFTAAALLAAPAAAFAGSFQLDPSHTQVGFRIAHLVIAEVEGRFDKLSGTFDYDEATRSFGNIAIEIASDSINTNEPDRDKHLRSPDFFDVGKYPRITFVSKGATLSAANKTVVSGELTIHGISRPVNLVVEKKGIVKDPWGNTVLVFTAKTEKPIARKDFGLTWNKAVEFGGVMVGEDVTIEIRGQAMPAEKK